MKTLFFRIAITSIILFLFANTAVASESKTHDGFFLRMGLGGGYANSSGGSYKIQGGAVDLELSIGGCIVENFAFHADIFGLFIPGPTVKDSGHETNTDADDVNFSINVLGGGFTYFFMPVNMYISLSAGISILQLQVSGFTFETDPGFGSRFMIGKDWWVGDEWGLGVAGNFIFSALKDEDDTTWISTGGGVLFSATFN